MKKIFTLIAAAMLSAGAYAQESFRVSAAPTDGQSVQATTNVKITYGNDGNWQLKQDGIADGLLDFVTGGQNPKDGDLDSNKKSTGSGYKADSKNLPKSGCYYIFETSKAGKIVIYAQLNADKEFFIADAGDGNNLTNDVNVAFRQIDETEDMDPTAGSNGGQVLGDKLKGSITFDVESNAKYYIFSTGSKLGIYGFDFNEGSSSGVNGIEAATTAAPVVKKFAENGQVVIEKAGKKFTAAGAQLK